ncbi:hemerythrin domain-containing protein [Aerosticca soli]|uniref:Hemerythrin-like domain-containing protein n=1 Tax=Aerosticca soli TaxID=2010829 RepID=A0A2Z6E1T4_9GAMM|nr:hemerythrin domain-containing protein [Aerosticca soli]BBD78950.1 hypothetical protein ALSL_0278 [Aerosticca soli]
MNIETSTRRRFLATFGVAGTGLLIAPALAMAAEKGAEKAREKEQPVTANEDLMREHGIIRRALLVYAEAARRIRDATASLPLAALADTATLFRSFAEDYHERALEETHIFPVVRRLKTPVAKLPDILTAQHQRGREITDFVLRVGRRGTLDADGAALATALEGFIRMYDPHADREDTEVFPAWKAALGAHGYEEMGERFEAIEHRTFGGDGFDEALARIAAIEATFGLADLAAVTPPPPG